MGLALPGEQDRALLIKAKSTIGTFESIDATDERMDLDFLRRLEQAGVLWSTSSSPAMAVS